MLLDLLHELSSGCVRFPIRLGKVTKLVRGGRLNETTRGTHVRGAEYTNLNGRLDRIHDKNVWRTLHLFPVGADGEHFDPLSPLSPLSLPEVHE